MRGVSDTGYTSAVLAAYDYRQNSDRIFKLSRIAVYNTITLPKHGPDGKGVCPQLPAAQAARRGKSIEEAP